MGRGGRDTDRSVVLAQGLEDLGVDSIDAPSGALVPKVRIPIEADGRITEFEQDDEPISGVASDPVLPARELPGEPRPAPAAQRSPGQIADIKLDINNI